MDEMLGPQIPDTKINNLQSALERAQSFVTERSKLSRYEEKKKLGEKFLTPFRKGELSFKGCFAEAKNASSTAEALRFTLSNDSYFSDNKKSSQENDELIFADLVDSLENINQLFESGNFEEVSDDPEQTKWRFRNNILYIISQVLYSDNSAIREKADGWLAEHLDDLKETGIMRAMPDGRKEMIGELTFNNIVVMTKNKSLLNYVLAITTDKENRDIVRLNINELLGARCDEEKQKEIVKFILSRVGIDDKLTDILIEKWGEAKTFKKLDSKNNDVYEGSYARNLKAAKLLESKEPSSVKNLFNKFGIANFDRYEPQTLLRQLEAEEINSPYGVVVLPEADWNGAMFRIKYELEKAGKELMKGGYEMRIIEASSQFDLSKKLLKFNKKYSPGGNKIDYLILCGHGSESSVQLGNDKVYPTPPPLPGKYNNDEEYKLAMEEYKKMWQNGPGMELRRTLKSDDIKNSGGPGIRRAAEEWFSKNMPLIYISCSTGAERGIAQTSSEELGFDTIAPNMPSGLKSIKVSFNQTGKPVFDVNYITEKEGETAETMKYFASKH